MKYLIEKKREEERGGEQEKQRSSSPREASHPIDNFFSLMAATVKNFSPFDQHYIKTQVFALVNDVEVKYLMSPTHSSSQNPVQYTPPPRQSPAHYVQSPTCTVPQQTSANTSQCDYTQL